MGGEPGLEEIVNPVPFILSPHLIFVEFYKKIVNVPHLNVLWISLNLQPKATPFFLFTGLHIISLGSLERAAK